MTYLELAPAITAIRSRPEEFEFSSGMLHHLRSRHSFRFMSDDDVKFQAACDCALLRDRGGRPGPFTRHIGSGMHPIGGLWK